jgi:glycosyltransferase involved in cell wall biosynthesis
LNKPRIAVLIDWYLPGSKAGGPVRSVHSLLELMKADYDFFVITRNTDLGETFPYKDIKPDTLHQTGDINYYYFSEQHLSAAAMLKVIRDINPHLIYLNSFWSFQFSINIVRLHASAQLPRPVLLAPRGMLDRGSLGVKSLKKNIFIGISRLSGFYRKVGFHATQEKERFNILKKFRSARVWVAPNINALQPRKAIREKHVNELNMFYLSRISPVKNLLFALKLLKEIPSQFKITYDIFGNAEDKVYWDECMSVIGALPSHIKVNYKGELSFDRIQETIGAYHCLLLPTKNENFGHSIVESLLSGCPAVISDQTPWSDLTSEGAGFALPLSSPSEYIKNINYLASVGQEEFNRISERAITYILKKTDASATKLKYKNMFDECIKDGLKIVQ